MYICLCKQVTDKQIETAIQEGASCIKAIQAQTGASTQCGCCMDMIEDMIAEHFVPISNIKIMNSAIEPIPVHI